MISGTRPGTSIESIEREVVRGGPLLKRSVVDAWTTWPGCSVGGRPRVPQIAGRLTQVVDEANEFAWYAVRCVFRSGWPPEFPGRAYEERITLWRATSFSEAIERAEAEAREYATTIIDGPDTYLDLAQAYLLDDEPGDGAEIFSLVRVSDLQPEAYLDRHFTTGTERQHDVQDPHE